MFQYRFIIPFSIFVKRHCAYKPSLKRNIWEDWVMCPCICWYINKYKITRTELSLAKMKIFYYNNCGGIDYWRKISIGKKFCCHIWPLHPNFSFCIPDGCVNPYICNTEMLHCKFSLKEQCGPSMTSSLTYTLFCFGQRTEVRFASFFSGGCITTIVINPPECNLAKCTSVQWTKNGMDRPGRHWWSTLYMYNVQCIRTVNS